MEEAQPAQVSKVRIYGRMGSAVGYMIRDFLHRNDAPFEWIEVTNEEQARALGLGDIRDHKKPVSVCSRTAHEWRDPRFAKSPRSSAGSTTFPFAVRPRDLWRRTGRIERRRLWRFRRAGYDSCGEVAVGGQASSSSKIENYLGFPTGISGAELAERAREQALRFGAELFLGAKGFAASLFPGKASVIWPTAQKLLHGAPSVPRASNIAG